MNIFLLSHPHQDSLILYSSNDLVIDDTDAGTYYLSIESSSALEPTFDIEVICPTIDADLIFTNGQVSPDFITSLQSNVLFSSTIKNIGNTTAATNTITYYLSDDMVYNAGTDIYLGSDVIPELSPGASTDVQSILNMPAGLVSGSKYVVFVADESNIVHETDDQNEYFEWIEVPETGLLDCSSSISLTDDVWYYDNTELNGINNVVNHHSVLEQTAPEIIHSFISPYSGMATISFTEKIPGKLNCIVYPICNENTYLATIWFNNITDTLASEVFYVNAGMEYYVIVDSELPVQGEYGVKINLPQECPNLVLGYWGDLELCDGDPYPSLDAMWGYTNYQWYKDELVLANETWSNYMPEQPGNYYVVVEENGCTAYSDTLTVSMSFPPDTATIVSLGAIEFCNGGSVDLQLDNSIAHPLQWTQDGEIIPGETNNLLTVNTSGNYSIITTNGSCSVESDTIIEVVVNNNPTDINEITSLPSDSIQFFFTFNEDNFDIINNYNFSCWDFLPADDRHGDFWQARDFSTGDYFGYASTYYEMPDEFTLSLWFNTTTTEGGMIASFVNTPYGPISQDAVLYMSDDGKLNFYMSDGGTPQELSSTNAYNDGNWHHVLIVHDSGILMEIDHNAEFVNISSPVAHSTFEGYWTFAGPELPIDVTNMPSSQYYDGLLDDIMVINEPKYMIRNYIDNTPKLDIHITSGDSILCDNGLAYFTLENSEFGIEYQVWNNTTSSFYATSEIGNGGTISLGGESINVSTEFMFLATNLQTGCETWLDTTINVYVYPSLVPTISISSDATDPICKGTMINFTAIVSNTGLSPQIDWYYNDILQGTYTETFNFDGFTDTDTVFAVVHSNYYCPSVDTSISNLNIHTVYPITTPDVVITSSEAGIACENTLITFTALATNCGTNPSYQWYRESTPVGTDSNIYEASDFTNGEEIYVVVSSDYACSSAANVESNHLITSISTIPESDITILSGGNCVSEEICFTYSGETENLDYVEWLIIEGGGGLPVVTFLGEGPHCFTPTNNIVDIIARSYNPESCYDTAWVSISALENMLTPTVSISTDETATYCQYYSEITFTATTTNSGINPTYQWYVNGTPEGTNSNIFSSYSLNNNDEIYCIVHNTITCATSNNVESNHININIEQAPVISVNTTGGTCNNEEICVNYDGSMTDVANINWIVRENAIETHIFSDVGPHCFMPTHENIEVVITVIGTNTCYDTLATNFSVNETPMLTIPDTLYKCINTLGNLSEATGYTAYNWSNGESGNSISIIDEGTYYLTVTNEHACNNADSVEVINYPDEDIVLVSDTTICMDGTMVLGIENEYVYDNIFWSDGLGTIWNEDNPEIGYMGNNPQFIYLEAQSEHCNFSDTIYIHFDLCNNVEDISAGIVRIYPNPANEQITISSDKAIGEIIIYDITGRIVYQTYTNNNKLQLDIDNWAKTTYILQTTNIKGESFKSGFIKI
ncbi:MAG: CARDB domain-containing protein [Bacteroidales bacterium]|nr:CARDB domain-containing protein [Bacteroidales bacterium]